MKEAIWLKGLAGDLGIQQLSIKTVRSAIFLANNQFRASLDDQTYCLEVPFNQRLWLKSLYLLEKIHTLEIQYICLQSMFLSTSLGFPWTLSISLCMREKKSLNLEAISLEESLLPRKS